VRTRPGIQSVKPLSTFHGTAFTPESVGWKAKLRNALAGLATGAVIVGSRERHAHFLRENYVARSKVIRIPFGVDVARYQPNAVFRRDVRQALGISDQTLVFGSVGHFGLEKGIDIAICAYARMQRQGLGAATRMIVVGSGSPEHERRLRELAAEAGEAIIFVPFQPEIERWYCAMDVLIHTPRLEAFGLVVAEAMACGLPVVGTAVGGVTDMVRDGHTGTLVPPQQLESAAEALACLTVNEGLRRQLSANAIQTARVEYSDALYVQRHLELYRQILADQRPVGVDECGQGNNTQGNLVRSGSADFKHREACDV